MFALITMLGVFAFMLVLARVRVPLAGAVLVGTVAIGLLFGLSVEETVRTIAAGAVQPATLALIAITVLLLALSHAMQSGGQMKQIVSLARAMLRRPALAMAALPALIGLLPMPGGALFSAPMVESAAGDRRLPGALLSAINYWFRHIWEHWWPLYPGVILAMTLTDSRPDQFMLFQMPLGLSMALAGLLIFRGTHPDLHTAGPRAAGGTARRLLRATSSVWLLLLVWAAASTLVRATGVRGMPPAARTVLEKYVPIALGLVVSLCWTAHLNRLGPAGLGRVFCQRSPYGLALLVLSVMVFRHMLGEAEAAPRIAAELTALKVPAGLVVVILPFVAGLVTGLAVGFVGTSFPIVLALVAAMPGEVGLRPYIALAYAFGHLGQMLSPLHLCHVVSNQYFKARFAGVYRHILPSAAVTAALAVAYFFLLRTLGPV
jgi:hypothetical protein